MKTAIIKFNNKDSQSFKAMVDQTANVVSYSAVVTVTNTLPQTVSRVNIAMDKVSRDTSDLKIFNIDFAAGTATIFYDENKIDLQKQQVLTNPNARIFINALTVGGEITAITGFTIVEVV